MQVNKDRLFFLDLFRALAIVLMFITHTFRVQVANPDISSTSMEIVNNIFNFFMYIEPFTSALFLFLVGFSLKYSYSRIKKNNLNKWKNKHKKKSIQLIIISLLLHIPYYGFNLIEMIFSSGVLMAIGVAIYLLIYSLNNKKRYILFFIGLILSIFLEVFNFSIIGVNAGAGAILPLILYSFIGFEIYDLKLLKKEIFILLLISLLTFIFISQDFRYIVSNTRYILDLNSFTIVNKNNLIWNHSIFGFIFNSIILTISSLLFKIKTKKQIKFIKQLSENSLNMYIVHILILSLFYINNIGIPNPIFTLIFLIILIFICLRVSIIYRMAKNRYLDSNV